MTWLYFLTSDRSPRKVENIYYLVPIKGARHVPCLHNVRITLYVFNLSWFEDNKLLEAIALFILPCVASNMVDLHPQTTRIVLPHLQQRNWSMSNAKPLCQKKHFFGCSRQQRLIFRVSFHVSTGGSNASSQPKRACVKIGTQYSIIYIYISWCLGISSGFLFGPLCFGFCLGFSGCFGPRRANWWCRGSRRGRPHSPWMAGHGTHGK